MGVNVSFAGQTFSIPNTAGESGWASNLTSYLQAIASNAATSTIQKQNIRTALTTPVNVATTDYAVVTNLTTPGAVTVALPAGVTGQIYAIVDGKGDAKTNNVVVQPNGAQLINNIGDYIINENYGGATFQFDGTGWRIISDFVGQDPTFATIKITSLSTGLLHSDASGNVTSSLLVNADVSASAAIAYSKLALTGAILNADLAGSIAYSKLSLTGAILNADLAGAITDSKLVTISTGGKVSNSATTATNANTASAIVSRDGSGNFLAGTITANLTGNASGTAANVTGIVATANGGTGQNSTATFPTSGTILNDTNTVTGINNKTFGEIKVGATPSTPGAGLLSIAYQSSNKLQITGQSGFGAIFDLNNLTTTQTFALPNTNTSLVSKDSIDFLTNKTFISSTSATTGALQLPPGTTAQRPGSPVAGYTRFNSDLNAFEGYANGAWSSLGGGLNEAPVKNYLKLYATSDIAPGTLSTVAVGGNITVASGTSAFYADVTSGSAALTSSASTLLRGSNNYLSAVSGAALAGTTFFQLPAMTLETADAGKPISISFDTTGNTLDGDYDVVVANYTSAGVFVGLIPVAGNASSSTSTASAKIPTGTSVFNGFFVSTSTAGDVFALRFRRLANAVQIRIDSLMVGNTPVRVGAPVTDEIAYTGVVSGGGTATFSYPNRQQWRVGKHLWLRYQFNVTANGSGATAVTIPLPGGITIDASAIPSEGILGHVGRISSASVYQASVAARVSSGTITICNEGTGAVIIGANLATNQQWSLLIQVPITEWSSNITLADRAVEEMQSNSGAGGTAANTNYTTGMVAGAAGSQFASVASTTAGQNTGYQINWSTVVQRTDAVIIEVSSDSGTTWSNTGANICSIGRLLQSTSEYGMWYEAINSTSGYVKFGNKGRLSNNVSYAGDGLAWSGIAGSSQYLWRVRKVSSGAQIGGAISTANIVGRVDGSTVGTGYIGEQIRSAVSTNTAFPTSNTYGDLTSISLTPGVWDINVGVYASLGSATTFTSWVGGVGTGSGTSTAGVVVGDSVFVALPPTSASDAGNSVSQFRVVVPSGASVPYYLKYQAIYTGTAPNARGRISAVRVA